MSHELDEAASAEFVRVMAEAGATVTLPPPLPPGRTHEERYRHEVMRLGQSDARYRREALALLRLDRAPRVDVPARTLEDRAPRPRRRSSRARARAPARPDDDPDLDLAALRVITPEAFAAIVQGAGL